MSDKGKETPLTDPMDEYFEKEQQRYLPITGRQAGKSTKTKAISNSLYPDLTDILKHEDVDSIFGISGKQYDQWRAEAVVYKKEIEGTFNECKHEPIDVGFMQTKMVCKKCDKDL